MWFWSIQAMLFRQQSYAAALAQQALGWKRQCLLLAYKFRRPDSNLVPGIATRGRSGLPRPPESAAPQPEWGDAQPAKLTSRFQ
jgi:hypothetical protein